VGVLGQWRATMRMESRCTLGRITVRGRASAVRRTDVVVVAARTEAEELASCVFIFVSFGLDHGAVCFLLS